MAIKPKLRCLPAVCLLASSACLADWSGASIWTFDDAQAPLKTSQGEAQLTVYDPRGFHWHHRAMRVSTPQRFGIPALPGDGQRRVLQLAVRDADQGLRLSHAAPPNGAMARYGQLSNYTLVADVYWPSASQAQSRALIQTDSANADDADLFFEPGPGGGLGVNGVYDGRLAGGRWHRIAISVRAATGSGGVGHINKVINGRWVGSHNTQGLGDSSRWGLGRDLLLFSDDDGETAPLYIASLMFWPRAASLEQLNALGGVHALGPLHAGVDDPLPPAVAGQARFMAHRGHSCCAPENTLSAVRQAVDLGVPFIEVDVRLSADGVAVLMHDATVERTTNGRGAVSQLAWSRLQQLDAGSWFDPDYRSERVPRLSQVLAITKGRAIVYLDVKDSRLAPAIANALQRSGASPDDIRVWETGRVDMARRFRRHLPRVPLIWGSPVTTDKQFQVLKQLGVVGFELAENTVQATFIEQARQHNMSVAAFTVFSPQRMQELLHMGVDIIETDFPAQLRARLAN